MLYALMFLFLLIILASIAFVIIAIPYVYKYIKVCLDDWVKEW